MSEAPGGGGYLPRRCSTSGRLTPAAATSIRISPAAGTGSGRSASFRTSGGPDCVISTALHFSPDGRRGDDSSAANSRQRRAGVLSRPTLLLDVGAHQVLAEVVVDHVAAVLLDELDALLGARLRVHRVLLEPRDRAGAIDLAVDVLARRLVARIRQPIDQRRARRSTRRPRSDRGRPAETARRARSAADRPARTPPRCRSWPCPRRSATAARTADRRCIRSSRDPCTRFFSSSTL